MFGIRWMRKESGFFKVGGSRYVRVKEFVGVVFEDTEVIFGFFGNRVLFFGNTLWGRWAF